VCFECCCGENVKISRIDLIQWFLNTKKNNEYNNDEKTVLIRLIDERLTNDLKNIISSDEYELIYAILKTINYDNTKKDIHEECNMIGKIIKKYVITEENFDKETIRILKFLLYEKGWCLKYPIQMLLFKTFLPLQEE
jgi:hypothetical protein